MQAGNKNQGYGGRTMKTSHLFGAICAFTLAVLSTTVSASYLMLEEFDPGTPGHIVIVSVTTHDPTSSEGADYDASRRGRLRSLSYEYK